MGWMLGNGASKWLTFRSRGRCAIKRCAAPLTLDVSGGWHYQSIGCTQWTHCVVIRFGHGRQSLRIAPGLSEIGPPESGCSWSSGYAAQETASQENRRPRLNDCSRVSGTDE